MFEYKPRKFWTKWVRHHFDDLWIDEVKETLDMILDPHHDYSFQKKYDLLRIAWKFCPELKEFFVHQKMVGYYSGNPVARLRIVCSEASNSLDFVYTSNLWIEIDAEDKNKMLSSSTWG